MFGYVIVNKPEMKFKDFDVYRSFYCGLCRELKRKYGVSGQISISYDMTFVVMLLSGLYEPPTKQGTTRCAVHPVHKQQVRKNEMTEYGADMNILLTYYKCMDDWNDEKKVSRRIYAALLQNRENHLEEVYKEKIPVITEHLERLSAWEKEGEKDLDKMAGCFEKLWRRFLQYDMICGKNLFEKSGFILESLSTFLMLMMMWKKTRKMEITIRFLKSVC